MPIAINWSDVTPQVLKSMKSEMLKALAKRKSRLQNHQGPENHYRLFLYHLGQENIHNHILV